SHAEMFPRGILIATDNDHCAGPHMFLLANNAGNTTVPEVSEGFRGMLEQSRHIARLARRHCWRQINQPLGVRSKAAHYLQRRSRVLFPNSHVAVQASVDDPLAGDIGKIKKI